MNMVRNYVACQVRITFVKNEHVKVMYLLESWFENTKKSWSRFFNIRLSFCFFIKADSLSDGVKKTDHFKAGMSANERNSDSLMIKSESLLSLFCHEQLEPIAHGHSY